MPIPSRSSRRFSTLLILTVTASLWSADATSMPARGMLVGGMFTAIGHPVLGMFSLADGRAVPPMLVGHGVRTALQDDPYTYVAGSFTNLGDVTCNGLARLDAHGQPDATWHPHVTGEVHVVAIHGDRVYLGGQFTAVDGTPRSNVAAVDAHTGHLLDWSADADGAVQALAVTPEGLMVGGSFMNVGGAERTRMARVDLETGKVDPSFNTPADAEVRALAIVGNRLVMGGFFARVGTQDRHGLALLDLPSGAVVEHWRPDVDGAVMSLTADKAWVVAGGVFSSARGQARQNAVIINTAHGTLDETLLDADGPVTCVSRDAQGRIYLSGSFTMVNGQATSPLVRWDPATKSLDASWRPPVGDEGSTTACVAGNRLVTSISRIIDSNRPGFAVMDDQGAPSLWTPALEDSRPRVLAAIAHGPFLYVGGDFRAVGGSPIHHLARFYRAHGGPDTSWHGDANGTVSALAVDGQDLLVGGDFTTLRGIPARSLGALPLDGKPPHEVIAVPGTVTGIQPVAAGLVITGSFTTVGGTESPGAALVGRTGGVLQAIPLGQGGGPGTGWAVTMCGSRVLIGGAYDTIQGRSAGHLAVVDDHGQVQSTLLADGPIYALLPIEDGAVIGGAFTRLGDEPRARLARVDAQGAVTPWRADADLDVRCLARLGADLWVGGDFHHLGGRSAERLGRVDLGSGQGRTSPGLDDRPLVLAPLP